MNQQAVQLKSLEGLKTTEIPVENRGTITVHFIDAIEHYRSSKLRGITWWVKMPQIHVDRFQPPALLSTPIEVW